MVGREEKQQESLEVIERYRKQVKGEYLAKLSQERERMVGEGKHLFEGRWLTVEEIQKLRRERTRRHLAILFELLLLFLGMALASYSLYRVLRFLLPK